MTPYIWAALTSLLWEMAFSAVVLAEIRYPEVSSPEIYTPLCHLQMSDGRTFNLEALCEEAPETTTDSPAPSDAIAPTLEIRNFSYDGNSIGGQVINNTNEPVRQIRVNYEVLDEGGNPIDNGFIYADPAIVPPGNVATFRGAVSPGANVQPTFVEWTDVN